MFPYFNKEIKVKEVRIETNFIQLFKSIINRGYKIGYIIAFFVFVLVNESEAQCDGRYLTDIFEEVERTTVKFGENIKANGQLQELYMDIYTPVGDLEEDRPLIILGHGGAFLEIAGDRRSNDIVRICEAMALKGYVCASYDYRLESNPFNLIFTEMMIKTIFRSVHDGKAALRYFKKSAEEDNNFNIDSDQIIIGGVSAGALLALNLVYITDLDMLPWLWGIWTDQLGGDIDGISGNPGYNVDVKGVINISGAIGKPYFMNGNNIPILNIHGTADRIIPFGAAKPFGIPSLPDVFGSKIVHEKAIERGIESTLIKYQGRGHVPFFNSSLEEESAYNEEIFDSTVTHITDFVYGLLNCNPDNQIVTGIIEDIESKSIELYPNPTSGQINLNVANRLAYSQVSIFSFDGAEIMTLKLNGTNLETKLSLPPGIYSLVIVEPNNQEVGYSKRFIVM